MKLIGNDIIIYRGENFTIDRSVINRDGSPFVVSSRLLNPYILVTVSTDKREQTNRYIKNWWLDASNYPPRFEHTQIQKISSFPSSLPSTMEVGDAVYTDGRSYKYWNDKVTPAGWTDYQFRIVKQFSSDETNKWISQNYTYSVSLVSGTSLKDFLRKLCERYQVISDDNVVDMYNKLTAHDQVELNALLQDIDLTKPLYEYSSIVPIVPPSKLTVISNIKGGYN